MHPDTPRVKGQNSAYRRGLVLGLTMAEAMLLILFMLLLVLGSILANRESEIHRLERRNAETCQLWSAS